MQHEISPQTWGPAAEPMGEAVASCVHCGFCLPTCPTYAETGQEMHSPRGRILLMKGVLEGELTLEEVAPYVDACLGCLACVTACPSGVQYGHLITPFRMETEKLRARPAGDRATRRLILETLPYPKRFRAAAAAGRLAKPLARALPGRLGDMLSLLPARVPRATPLPEVHPAEGERRARVALLAGCAQQVLEPDITAATLRVLAKNGVETLLPASQSCCGALAAHTGAKAQAQAFARNNLKVFPQDVDAILTNAAGCGSGLREYALWLKGEPEEAAAAAFAARVVDVSVFLHRLGPRRPKALRKPVAVAYHDACHLAHAQGVRAEPRALLSQIDNLTLLEMAEPELCCGSAGTYNLEHPEMAARLGARKATAVPPDAQAVVTGNIGCLTQLRAHLAAAGRPLPSYHTLQLLDRAYRGL